MPLGDQLLSLPALPDDALFLLPDDTATALDFWRREFHLTAPRGLRNAGVPTRYLGILFLLWFEVQYRFCALAIGILTLGVLRFRRNRHPKRAYPLQFQAGSGP